jgi:hypothetical protein
MRSLGTELLTRHQLTIVAREEKKIMNLWIFAGVKCRWE